MQDRLPDLLKFYADVADKNLSDFPVNNSVVLNVGSNNTQLFDIELQMGLRGSTDSSFFNEISSIMQSIKGGINTICNSNNYVMALQNKINEATDPQQEKAIKSELNTVLTNTNRVALKVKDDLNNFKTQNEKIAEKSGAFKMRESLHVAMAKRFRDVIKEYQTVQTSVQKVIRIKAERQIRVVFPDIQKEELNHMMEDGELSAEAAMKMQLSGQVHQSLELAVSELQDKYEDIKLLEKTVQELHQLFVDLSTLIADQDDLLDQIDYSVNAAVDYTAKGERELIAARKSQKKVKKRMVCISTVICVVVLIILLPIILHFSR